MWGLSRYYGITSPNLTKALWFQNVLYVVILKEKKKLINFEINSVFFQFHTVFFLQKNSSKCFLLNGIADVIYAASTKHPWLSLVKPVNSAHAQVTL